MSDVANVVIDGFTEASPDIISHAPDAGAISI